MKIDSKNQTFHRVENFDIEALRKAFAEGRLYVQPRQENPDELRERGIHSILEYVSRIDDCTSSIYRPYIREVWERIVREPSLTELFFLNRYASSKGKVNWYRVNVFICLMLERGIYRKEYTGVDLHCLCEGTTKKGMHYMGMYRYQLESHYLTILKRTLTKFGTESQKNRQ